MDPQRLQSCCPHYQSQSWTALWLWNHKNWLASTDPISLQQMYRCRTWTHDQIWKNRFQILLKLLIFPINVFYLASLKRIITYFGNSTKKVYFSRPSPTATILWLSADQEMSFIGPRNGVNSDFNMCSLLTVSQILNLPLWSVHIKLKQPCQTPTRTFITDNTNFMILTLEDQRSTFSIKLAPITLTSRGNVEPTWRVLCHNDRNWMFSVNISHRRIL